MDDPTKDRIKRATVTVLTDEKAGDFGRGFFVHGGYILTAAHCVPWSGEGQMPLGDYFLVDVLTADGARLTGQVVAVEPVSDLAVIASPDNQTFYEKADAYNSFAESVVGLHLCKDEFPFGREFPIHIFTHRGDWLSGKAAQWGDNAPSLSVETEPAIQGGTSGSAIVNDCGEVVGIVSNMGQCAGDTEGAGSSARPCQSLPVWLWRAIKAAEEEGNSDE